MKQKADILQCTADDISEICFIEEKYIPNGWSEKAFHDWLEYNNNTVIFKAVLNGETVGFVNGSWVLDEGELLNIAVVESQRNRGIASQLLNALEKYFVNISINSVFLEVREKNCKAINFYSKHGFVQNGFRKNYYKNPQDNAVLMAKKINEGE